MHHERFKIKSRRRDEDVLLSKNNTKTLLFRNAYDAESLKKEERILLRERSSDENIISRKENICYNDSCFWSVNRRKEIDANNKRQILSAAHASLSLLDIRVAASRSNSFSNHCGGRPVRSYSLIPPSPLSMSSRQLSPPRSRNKLFPDSASGLGNQSQLSVSLPDIHGATGKIGRKKLKIGGELQCNTKRSSCEETCYIDVWEKLGKCRYWRTSSAV